MSWLRGMERMLMSHVSYIRKTQYCAIIDDCIPAMHLEFLEVNMYRYIQTP